MVVDHKKRAFEPAIEHHLTTAGGYAKDDREAFDHDRGLFPADVISFGQKTRHRREVYRSL